MSATALPTKPCGERPPIFPPTLTTFDGAAGDDSWITRLTDEVRRICRFADAAEGEELDRMILLLDTRRHLVAKETMLRYALDNEFTVPPVEGISIDFLVTSTMDGRRLERLIDQLDSCKARCERRLSRYRFEMRLSRDLDSSDS